MLFDGENKKRKQETGQKDRRNTLVEKKKKKIRQGVGGREYRNIRVFNDNWAGLLFY